MAKKATKAELIQEWCETDKGWVPIVPHHQEDHLHAYRSKNSGLLYRPAPSGCLEPWADGSLPLQAGAHVQFVQARGHVLAYKVDIRSNAKLRGPRDPLEEESTLTLLWDSEGQLPCPLPIEVDGRCVYGELLPQWDGGLLVYLYGVRYGAFNSMIRDLIRYSPSGEVLWKKDLRFATPVFCPNGVWLEQLTRTGGQEVRECVWLDQEGEERARVSCADSFRKSLTCRADSDELWILLENKTAGPGLLRLERSGEETRGPLSGGGNWLHLLEDAVLCLGSDLTLLARDTLQARASLPGKSNCHFLEQDGRGRLWLESRGTVECCDGDLHEVSRHRLKGSVVGSHLDGEENLCVVTYQAKEELVRVYRLS